MKKYSLPLEKLGIGFMPYLSLIVPVYNRPQEVQELLESLAAQDSRDFEIIIVEDGSTVRCDRIVLFPGNILRWYGKLARRPV